MKQRRIVIDIFPTMNRKKFDLILNCEPSEADEGLTREQIHNSVREALNEALESLT